MDRFTIRNGARPRSDESEDQPWLAACGQTSIWKSSAWGLSSSHEQGKPVFAEEKEAVDHLSGLVQPLIPDKAILGVKERFHKVLAQASAC